MHKECFGMWKAAEVRRPNVVCPASGTLTV
jgi:hypothetical protein